MRNIILVLYGIIGIMIAFKNGTIKALRGAIGGSLVLPKPAPAGQ